MNLYSPLLFIKVKFSWTTLSHHAVKHALVKTAAPFYCISINIHPSLFRSGVYPSCHRGRGRVHPGVASVSGLTHRQIIHTSIYNNKLTPCIFFWTVGKAGAPGENPSIHEEEHVNSTSIAPASCPSMKFSFSLFSVPRCSITLLSKLLVFVGRRVFFREKGLSLPAHYSSAIRVSFVKRCFLTWITIFSWLWTGFSA